MDYTVYEHGKKSLDGETKTKLVNFLHTHLEQYGDPKEDIERCINFALKENKALKEGFSFGGFVITASDDAGIRGAVIVNRTGMSGYIPENILVYIATHRDFRGQGLGKKLMEKTIALCEGNIKLHVEPNNPARHLYTKYGFTAPYLEMRYKR